MKLKLEVQQDYIEKHINRRSLTAAVAELIWNALDGDAHKINLNFIENTMGAINALELEDDGHGIQYDIAQQAFRNLGNSWKKTKLLSPSGRQLHGRGGEGRLAAFAIGRSVTWDSRWLDNGKIHGLKISGNLDFLSEFEIDSVETKTTEKIGTKVSIANLQDPVSSLLSEGGQQKIAEIFALYLKAYPAQIYIKNQLLDPSKLEESSHIKEVKDFKLPSGKKANFTITVIEWKHKVDRVINLCDTNGFPLSTNSTIIQAPGFNFSVYINSSAIKDMHDDGTLEMGDLNTDLQAIVERAKSITKDYFRKRLADKAKSIVQEWKDTKVYPFKDAPSTPVEEVERQVFNVVALQINEYLPEFSASDAKSKKFSLQMLKSAIEKSPHEVQKIIQEVLALPKEKLEELSQLLEKTRLTSIINASKLVTDRLDFLAGVDSLIFNPESKKKVLERKHLHRIVAENTWLFGEEFSLTVDDEALTQVLKKHLKLLGKDRKDLAPVTDLDGKNAIVDLMLSKQIPQTKEDQLEHLVIELKRPTQKINSACLEQTEKYAFAVSEDERFKDTNTKWVFWVISNEMDTHTRKKITKQNNRPDGLAYESEDRKVQIWAKSWAQVIEDCKVRLKIFQKKLDYSASHDSGLEYLSKTHSKYLPNESIKSPPKTKQSHKS